MPLGRVPEAELTDEQVFFHKPVLLKEVLDAMQLFPGARVLDCTLGGGGHSGAILERLQGTGLVTGLDCDDMALEAAQARLGGHPNFRALRVNFGDLEEGDWLELIGEQDRVLMDLGVSSPQLDRGERGFSIRNDGELDMRMDRRLELTAAEIVADYSESELRRIFFEFGEESAAGKIARRLVQERSSQAIRTTADLARVVCSVVGRPRPGKIHPATKIFQALRMEVNREVERLQQGLKSVFGLLGLGGRLIVLSYHSLEDRCVKRFIQEREGRCRCPRGVPVCQCGAVQLLRACGKATASPEEILENPRARSVRMRVAEKVAKA